MTLDRSKTPALRWANVVIEGIAFTAVTGFFIFLVWADSILPPGERRSMSWVAVLLVLVMWAARFVGRIGRKLGYLPLSQDDETPDELDRDQGGQGAGQDAREARSNQLLADGWTAHPMPWPGGEARSGGSPNHES